MNTRALLTALVVALLMTACGSETSEDQIRALVADMASAAEKEKMRPLARAISDDYRDLRDNDRQAVINLMRGFMLRTDDVLIFTDVREVTMITADLAAATVKVRFAGADWERLRLQSTAYLFELEFSRRNNDWQIVTARWAEGDAAPR